MSTPLVWSWKGKKQKKKMLNRAFESSHQDVNTAVCRATSAQPPCLHALRCSSHPTPSPSSCFLWILPAALSCLRLPDSLTAHTPTSDLHQHDLPGEDQFSHFQPKCWLKERSLKRRLSDTVMTNSSLTLRSGGGLATALLHSVVFTQQFCQTKSLCVQGSGKQWWKKVYNCTADN